MSSRPSRQQANRLCLPERRWAPFIRLRAKLHPGHLMQVLPALARSRAPASSNAWNVSCLLERAVIDLDENTPKKVAITLSNRVGRCAFLVPCVASPVVLVDDKAQVRLANTSGASCNIC
jgi:hypothetical protein